MYYFRVETIDGTATEEQDYVPINQVITFESGETEKFVSIFPVRSRNLIWLKTQSVFE